MVERGGRDIGLGTTGREREGREREREREREVFSIPLTCIIKEGVGVDRG